MRYKKRYKLAIAIILSLLLMPTAINTIVRQNKQSVRITAHRGSSSLAPENTLPALEAAINDGADCIEIDVRKTKDGQIVLLHDQTLDRTTDLSGCVNEMNYSELSAADAGSWFGEAYKGTGIPTLEQALAVSKGRINLNIELKDCGGDETFVREVLRFIEEYQMTDSCCISSTNYDYLVEMKALNSHIRTGIILQEYEVGMSFENADFISVSYHGIDGKEISQIHNIGKEVHVWTIEEQNAIRQTLQWGADNIISNSPGKVRSMLDMLS